MKKMLLLILVVASVGIVLLLTNERNPATSNTDTGVNDVFVLGEQIGNKVVVERVVLNKAGFVALREVINEKPGQIIEVSEYLTAGEYTNIVINLVESVAIGEIDISGEFSVSRDIVAVVYEDDGDKGFNPFLDTPAYIEGKIVARYVSSGNMAPDSAVVPVVDKGYTVVATIVEYTDDGFSPNQITINKGETVRFVNKSSRSMWVASNVHPAHTILSTFDQFGTSEFGESYQYTFDQIGEWEYHDHVNASETGVIVVE